MPNLQNKVPQWCVCKYIHIYVCVNFTHTHKTLSVWRLGARDFPGLFWVLICLSPSPTDNLYRGCRPLLASERLNFLIELTWDVEANRDRVSGKHHPDVGNGRRLTAFSVPHWSKWLWVVPLFWMEKSTGALAVVSMWLSSALYFENVSGGREETQHPELACLSFSQVKSWEKLSVLRTFISLNNTLNI